MRGLNALAGAALLSIFSTAASAAIVQCGTATDYVSIDTTIASVCGGAGNGNNLNGIADPVNALGYTTLDTTTTIGVIPLTISTGGTSGSFSFGPITGYEHFVLGFQTTNNQPNPDWFYVFLADTITSGTWSIVGPGTAVLDRANLYGQVAEVVAPVPLPGAFFLFGSVIAGWFGFDRWRKRSGTQRMVAA